MTADIEKAPVANGTLSRKKKCDIFDLVGGDGPWQRRIFLVIFFVTIPTATHNLAMTFMAPNIDHWCARPPDAANLSVEQWKSIAIPIEDQHCSRYEVVNFTHPVQTVSNNSGEHQTIPCDVWEYDETFYTSTVLSQWDLVCDRQWLVSMSKSVFMAGILVAVTVFGYLADKLGRRPTMAACSFIAVCAAIICAFSTSFAMFIVARLFVAIGIAGCFNTAFVLLMEVVGPELRSIYGMAVQFAWCLGFVSLPAIAWLLRDWFWIQITLTAPCFFLLAIWWMIPESPRWLLAHGKVEEAHKVLTRAAKLNGVKLTDIDTTLKKVMTKATEIHESGGSNANILDLLRTPGLWQMTLNLYFIWFVNAFVYYGLSYNTNELAGDPFINFALSGAVEFPAYFLSIFAIRSLGRRNPLAGTMVIGGLACLLSYPLPQNPWWLTVTVSMIGKFCITCSFGIVYVFTTELFPTVVRNVGLGSASFCARFGSILAPFIRELGNATHPVVPQIVFGILAAVSGALVLLLPETNNCIVPDTLKEAAEVSRRQCKKPKLLNGNHVIVTLSNGEADNIQEDMTDQAVFAPSPKPEKNGKIEKNGKLADVPEEDSHCEDADEPDIETAETKELEEKVDPASADTEEEANDVPTTSTEKNEEPEDVDIGPESHTTNVSAEINNTETEALENIVEIQEQKSEL